MSLNLAYRWFCRLELTDHVQDHSTFSKNRHGRFRDSDGRPPRHTFFYPPEEYEPQYLDALTELCQAGFGEVEVHIHHRHDTAESLRDKLTANTKQFRTAMTAAGFNIKPGEHPICPIMLGDAKLAVEVSKRMLDEGIYVIGFSFPVVPEGKARIRVQISAGHSADDINRAVAAFTKVGRELKVIS